MTRTIRELIIELAQVEDALRHTPLHRPGSGANTSLPYGFVGTVNTEIIELASREEAILRELRGRDNHLGAEA
ncbi:hypothetical protein ACWEOW_00245 [Monashia sp. NPDC004114]